MTYVALPQSVPGSATGTVQLLQTIVPMNEPLADVAADARPFILMSFEKVEGAQKKAAKPRTADNI